ncbi:MAG: hypothetical protein ACK5Q5_03425 [Planctomycetaceae bacterium]
MSSPFQIFRKHQKILLVVLVGLSMLSFVIFDAVQQFGNISNMPATLTVITLALLVGAVAWAFGLSNQKSSEYGSIGLIAGAAIGLVFMLQGRRADTVTLGEFQISQTDLSNLMNHRMVANRFVQRAVERTNPDMNEFQRSMLLRQSQFGFGHPEDQLDQDVILGDLLRREGKKVGMELPDSAVHAFIKRVTNDKMTREAFKEIRNELRVSEADIVDSIRQELLAREAALTLYSRVDLPPAVDWEFSQQLQVRETATTAGVPVSAFVDDKSEPPTAELQQLFEAFKANLPGVTSTGRIEEGRPGFYQPPRIKLAYVTPDYQAFENQVQGTVTDAEIEARYQKDYVEAAQKPDDGPAFPEMPTIPGLDGLGITPSMGPALTPPTPNPETTTPKTAKPKPEAAPETKADSEAKPDLEVKPTPEVKAAPEAKPSPETTPAPEAKAASPAKEDSVSNEKAPASEQDPTQLDADQGCDDQPTETAPAAEAPAEMPADAAPSNPAQEEADKPADDKPAAASPPAPADNKPAAESPAIPPAPADKAAQTSDGISIPDTPEPAPPVPSTPVRPLDDTLKAEIREQLIMDKTDLALEKAMSEAIEKIRNEIGRNVHAPPGSASLLTVEAATEQIEAYAAAHNFRYVESELMSYSELLKSDDVPVAQFRLQTGGFLQQPTVADELFSTSPKDTFRPRQADHRDRNGKVIDRAIYWKLDHHQAYEPANLDDERVRKQVVQTWRELNARKLAEARAKELADLVRGSDKPMLETLADVTVSGKAGTQLVNIMQTGQFSWMRQTIVPAMTLQGFDIAPERSTVPGVENAGNDFMHAVFEDLKSGDVGVAPNADRSTYYVVKVDTRTPSTEAEWTTLRNNFLSGQNDNLVERLGAEMYNSEVPYWANELFRKYDVRLPDEMGGDAEG